MVMSEGKKTAVEEEQGRALAEEQQTPAEGEMYASTNVYIDA